MRKLLFMGVPIVVLVAFASAAMAGWNGDTYIGTSGPDHAIGNESANTIWLYDGPDWAEGRAGNDQIRGGKGQDVLEGEGGYDTLWACGHSDNCDGSPGADAMKPGADGGQVNAGQFPAKKQFIYCTANGFEEVYFDSADDFQGTKSDCDVKHNVSSAAQAVNVG